MKYLIRRAFIDVGWLLLTIFSIFPSLLFVMAVNNQLPEYWSLMDMISAYLSYIVPLLLVLCAIRFAVSLIRNLISVGQHMSTANYTFENVAEIIGKKPDAFENWDGQ